MTTSCFPRSPRSGPRSPRSSTRRSAPPAASACGSAWIPVHCTSSTPGRERRSRSSGWERVPLSGTREQSGTMDAMTEDRSPVESVDRALGLIEVLSQSGSGLSLDQIAQRSGLPKSSLHRTLAALKRRGFATQQRETGKYILGPQLLRAAFDFYDRLDVRTLVRPVPPGLPDRVNET